MESIKDVRGIIVEKSRTPNGNRYTLFDGEKFHTFETDKNIRSRAVSVSKNTIEELGEEIFNEVKEKFFEKVKYPSSIPDYLTSVSNNFERLWKELAFAKITGERIQVFYDADADGIISALLISEVVRSLLKPVSPRQLELATGLFPDFSASLYLLLDVGSGDLPGVRFLNSLKDVYIIDHHIADGCSAVCVNPAIGDPEKSKYFTALIVSHLVEPWVKREEWVRVAAAGDRSDVIPWSDTDRKKALALEISTELLPQNPQTWKRIINGLWKDLYDIVEHRFELVDELAEKEEVEINGQKVLIIKYPYPGFSYPHRGKVASWYMEKGYDTVIVIETDRRKEFTVSIRSKENVLSIIRKVENEGLGRGWGHPNAVSIRTHSPQEVLKLLGLDK